MDLVTINFVCDVANWLVVQRSWNSSYELNYHRLLLENITSMPRSKPYSSTASIIQSSGYGKSRMVNEMANLMFTLPFNLRDPKETKGVVNSRFISRSTDSAYSRSLSSP